MVSEIGNAVAELLGTILFYVLMFGGLYFTVRVAVRKELKENGRAKR